jgi:CRP/FNR family cyclic AMP-dependent transcriptional regulator
MLIDIDTLLAWGATYKKLVPGEIVFTEGSSCNFYFQVVSGSIRWMNINQEGREVLQVMVEPGECFGEMPLFDDGPYAATAIANEAAVIIRLSKSSFHKLLHDNPELHFAFSRLMSERLRFKFLLLREIACHDPEQSITSLLAYFKRTRKNICTDCNRIKLTRQQIADMTGLRVETVIRTIKSLQRKGTLLVDKGKVYC